MRTYLLSVSSSLPSSFLLVPSIFILSLSSLSPGWRRRAGRTTSSPSSGRRTETDRNSSTPSSNSYATSSLSTTPRASRLIGPTSLICCWSMHLNFAELPTTTAGSSWSAPAPETTSANLQPVHRITRPHSSISPVYLSHDKQNCCSSMWLKLCRSPGLN